MAIDNRTPNLNLPLPNVNNLMKSEDVPRLRDAITLLDQAVFDRVTQTELDAAISALLGNAPPAALDTLNEIAAAINDDANFAAWVTTQLAGKLSSVPTATSVALGGIKVGSGLTIAVDGTLSTTGAGNGTGLPSFAELVMAPTSNGQTSFTPVGGYEPGQIELYLNGILLIGNGDDYTASNGTTIVLAVGANTVDKLLLRKWYYIPVEMAVNKTGDTMTGPLNVMANASGTQAPQVQEVVKKSGDSMTGALNTARATVASHATASDIWGAAGNDINWTGTVNCTVFPEAPQAGAERILICAGAAPFTAGANMLIDGVASGSTLTCAAGDMIVVRAITTTQFKLTRLPAGGVVSKAGDSMTGNLNFSQVDKGTVASGTVTFDVQAAFNQRLQVGGALTLAFSNWPASGIEGAVKLRLVNGGSAVVTVPTINWIKPDGTTTTSFSAYLTAISRSGLQASGTDFAVVWSVDAGTTLFGKLL